MVQSCDYWLVAGMESALQVFPPHRMGQEAKEGRLEVPNIYQTAW